VAAIDPVTRAALAVPPEALGRGSGARIVRVADRDALLDRFADDLIGAYRAAQGPVAMIVPVGPTGQYERIAERCNRERTPLRDLVLVLMDEYLDEDGALIDPADPLSFRGHLQRRLLGPLEVAPPRLLWPDPADLGALPRALDRLAVEVCFAGVGITGHLAFNDPPEEPVTLEAFRALPTRVVRLSRETRLVNAVNACRGNLDLIPERAVTLGMREILASRQLRLYLHRPYMAAMVRKLLHGPITPRVPASLVRTHPDVTVVLTEAVAALPVPG
jgi:glucosamine-6-phosphate deaminase